MTFRQALDELTTLAAACLENAHDSARTVGDDELLACQRQLAAISRQLDAAAAVVAGEVQHRSRRELGYDGLAQKRGAAPRTR